MIDRLTALIAFRPKSAEDWLARMGRPRVSVRDQDRFMAWLQDDPKNLDRYQAAKARSASLEPLRGAFQTDLAKIRWRPRRAAVPRQVVISGGLTVAAVIAAVMVLPLLPPPAGRLYESAPGRITDVVLPDGSRVTLDADSAIRARMAGDVRRVTLERGSAYFEVVHDAAHPFQVGVLDRKVTVTGTRFVTALSGEGAEVSLLEGQVVISRRDAPATMALAGGTVMAPGDRARFRAAAPVVRRAGADLETATAWRKRRLVFRDAPLSEVISAASRYSDRPLTIAEPGLGALRVTAILPLEGEDTLVSRIDALLPITVDETAEGWLIRAE